MQERPELPALRTKLLSVRSRPVVVPALYSVAAAAWIVLSDAAARSLLPPADFARWSTLKGLLFVLCTALVLHAALRRAGRRRLGASSRPAAEDASPRGVRPGGRSAEGGLEELRALATHVQAIREQEKARIARDLHDDLGQRLTALQLDVDWLDRRLRERAGGAGALLDRTATLSAHVQELAVSVQRIAAELRPPVLDQLGLGPALRREVREFGLRTGIACETGITDDLPALAEGAEIALYRIAQEALTNVARHARATWTRVALVSDAGGVTLSIEDDGRGMRPGEARPQALGILGMKERAAALGGEVRIGNGARGGTAVVTRVPPAAERGEAGAA